MTVANRTVPLRNFRITWSLEWSKIYRKKFGNDIEVQYFESAKDYGYILLNPGLKASEVINRFAQLEKVNESTMVS